jgi:predicted RecB family nuclease
MGEGTVGRRKAGETLAEEQPAVRLGAYAARRCAVRTQWDVVRPCEPAPDGPFRTELARRGHAFETDVIAELIALHPDAVVIDRSLTPAKRQAATDEAIAAKERLIIGPRLRHDERSGRLGEPDLLVRRGPAGYLPVDIKHHRTLDPQQPGDLRGVSGLAELGHRAVVPRPREAGAHDAHRDDLLQLAHYWRLLEDLGAAALGPPSGAIVGRERRVVWFDLTEQRFGDDGGRGERRSALAVYDAEYAERYRVAAAAAQHLVDASRPLPLVPVSIAECPDCTWREHCGAYLEDRQDVSLLPRVTRPAWEALHRAGVDTIPELAALRDVTVVPGMTEGALASAIAHARARNGEAVAYRRPGATGVRVERADVEVDVDMENVEDGAYLWGAYVTDRAGAGIVTPGYHAFVDWDADATIAGVRAFAGFWPWFTELRRTCAERGLTLRAYCWSEAAENRWLRAGARAIRAEQDVEDFIASEQWVDLMRVFDGQVITGRGRGLKVVAPLLGFAWADDDPSGAASMVWWQEAVDAERPPAEREQLRARLLAYNADDVRATLHVRDWLEQAGPGLSPLPTP